jgi:hypothetical protein
MKIVENFWQPLNNPPSHDKQEHLCHLLDTSDTPSPNKKKRNLVLREREHVWTDQLSNAHFNQTIQLLKFLLFTTL